MSKSYATDAQDYEARGIAESVSQVIDAVRRRGDAAVRDYALRQDGWVAGDFRLSRSQIEACVGRLAAPILDDIRFAQAQVRCLAEAQRAALDDVEIETLPGLRLGHRHIPVDSAGTLFPDSRLPPMAAAADIVAARAAGVPRIVAAAPPRAGAPADLQVAAMHLAGADEIYALAGVHALAAFALGTESIARVDVVVGSGDLAVVEAARQLFGSSRIDLAVGATEILIIADESADPALVAADLIGPCEHARRARGVLVTTSPALARRVAAEIERALADPPFAQAARLAWHQHGAIHVVESADDACALADRYAVGAVEILTEEPRWYLERLSNYATLFLGQGTAAAFSDVAVGDGRGRHGTRPARSRGGRWVGEFLKTVSYQECLDPESSRVAGASFARQWRREGFDGQARSCELRVAQAEQKQLFAAEIAEALA